MPARRSCIMTSLMAVAIDHHHGFNSLLRAQRCKLRSFTHLESAALELDRTNLAPSLKTTTASSSSRFHRSFSTPCLSTKADDESTTGPRVEIVAGHGGPRVRALVVEAAIALASGIEPVPAPSDLGGAYYLRSRANENIAVVKPINQEPLAMNNPKGMAGWIRGQPGMKRPVRVAETCVREVAAYLLDHDSFAGVQPTTLIKLSNVAFPSDPSRLSTSTAPQPPVTIASIQRFVAHDFDAGDLGPSSFSVASVHHIGILDIRLLNIDRHAGNILVKKRGHGSFDSYTSDGYGGGAAELVPIDHGLCLPEALDDPYFEWLHWPQASLPFSELEYNYISRLDPLKDAELLRSELPSLTESSVRILVLCTIFLKCAARSGLCLANIGDMMTREFHGTKEEPSMLETLCMEAMVTTNEVLDNDGEGLTKDEKQEEEEEMEQFQLDMDCGEICTGDHVAHDILDLPYLKLPKGPLRYLSIRSAASYTIDALSPLHEEDDDLEDNEQDNGNQGDHKVGCLTKSVSFAVLMKHKHEYIRRDISFGGMTEEEWVLFLERFEELLPKAFESWKSMGLKLRLGSSCRF